MVKIQWDLTIDKMVNIFGTVTTGKKRSVGLLTTEKMVNISGTVTTGKMVNIYGTVTIGKMVNILRDCYYR